MEIKGVQVMMEEHGMGRGEDKEKDGDGGLVELTNNQNNFNCIEINM